MLNCWSGFSSNGHINRIMKPVVLLFEPIHADAAALLKEKCEVRLAPSSDENVLLENIGDVDAIILRASGNISRRLMERAHRLKVIGRHGVGVDNIDLEAAKERGIAVVNTPDANTEAVAEHCIGMMIALSRKLLAADRAARQANWGARYELIGVELLGKTLGVVGFGRIGQRVATIAHSAFQMQIVYCDVINYPDAERALKARRVSLDELVARADVVSVHVPLLPETRGLIGARAFSMMKPSAFLINASRGPVIDETALVEALETHRIAGAGLDVFVNEPIEPDNPLLRLEHVILSPHMASHTDEAMRRMAMVAVDVLAVLGGREPRYRVV